MQSHGMGVGLSMPVRDVVSHLAITVAPGDSLRCAMTLMKYHRVRHLPVIASGKLVGIVSIGDVIKHRLDDLETESQRPSGRVLSGSLSR